MDDEDDEVLLMSPGKPIGKSFPTRIEFSKVKPPPSFARDIVDGHVLSAPLPSSQQQVSEAVVGQLDDGSDAETQTQSLQFGLRASLRRSSPPPVKLPSDFSLLLPDTVATPMQPTVAVRAPVSSVGSTTAMATAAATKPVITQSTVLATDNSNSNDIPVRSTRAKAIPHIIDDDDEDDVTEGSNATAAVAPTKAALVAAPATPTRSARITTNTATATSTATTATAVAATTVKVKAAAVLSPGRARRMRASSLSSTSSSDRAPDNEEEAYEDSDEVRQRRTHRRAVIADDDGDEDAEYVGEKRPSRGTPKRSAAQRQRAPPQSPASKGRKTRGSRAGSPEVTGTRRSSRHDTVTARRQREQETKWAQAKSRERRMHSGTASGPLVDSDADDSDEIDDNESDNNQEESDSDARAKSSRASAAAAAAARKERKRNATKHMDDDFIDDDAPRSKRISTPRKQQQALHQQPTIASSFAAMSAGTATTGTAGKTASATRGSGPRRKHTTGPVVAVISDDEEEDDNDGAESEAGETIRIVPDNELSESSICPSPPRRSPSPAPTLAGLVRPHPPFDEAFPIYIQYLVSCLLDPNFLDDIGQHPRDDYFGPAMERVEHDVLSKRDSLMDSSAWAEQFRKDLNAYPKYFVREVDTYHSCQACKRDRHVTHRLELRGEPYEAEPIWARQVLPEFERKRKKTKAAASPKPSVTYYIGPYCQRRTELYHTLHHYKRHLLKRVWKRILEAEHDLGSRATSVEVLNGIMTDDAWLETLHTELHNILEEADSYCADDIVATRG